eukprot:comp21411_c0_seq1/m.29502 comp21411_c0_seq1/g.29502  ORF comp21411_c0_seq1/g.29502 comp21411_c0_seq1/m.29502 type:complete len:554 (-) comp21411_c0_seq1:479-2140(-)
MASPSNNSEPGLHCRQEGEANSTSRHLLDEEEENDAHFAPVMVNTPWEKNATPNPKDDDTQSIRSEDSETLRAAAQKKGEETCECGEEVQKMTPMLVLVSVVAALPSFADGFANTVVNNSAPAVMKWFADRGDPLTSAQWAFIVALFPIGAFFGSFPAAYFIRRVGAHKAQLYNNAVYLTAGIMMLFTQNYAMLVVGRLIAGIGIGVNGAAKMIYIQECSTMRCRGPLTIVGQSIYAAGCLGGLVMGMSSVMGTPELWRWLYCLSVLPAVLHLAIASFLPESPRTLYVHGKEEKARRVLEKLRGTKNVDREYEEYRLAHEKQVEIGNKSFFGAYVAMFTNPYLLRPLLIVTLLPITTPFASGYFVVYYSNQTFTQAGLSNGELAGVFVGVAMFLSTLVSNPLVEWIGRKRTMLLGWMVTSVMAAMFTVASQFSHIVAWNHAAVAFLLGIEFFGFFAMGVQVVIAPELFPTEQRCLGVATNQMCMRVAQAGIAFVFPLISNAIGNFSFLLCTGTAIVSCLFVAVMVPETRGLTMEQVQAKLEKDYRVRKNKSNA